MEIPSSGNIKDTSLIKNSGVPEQEPEDGTLSLMTPSFTKNILFDGGDVIFASSTYEDDRLGECS